MCFSFSKYSHMAQNKFIYKDEAEEDLGGTAANNAKQQEISQKRSPSDQEMLNDSHFLSLATSQHMRK